MVAMETGRPMRKTGACACGDVREVPGANGAFPAEPTPKPLSDLEKAIGMDEPKEVGDECERQRRASKYHQSMMLIY